MALYDIWRNIRAKSRSDWKEFWWECYTNCRIWVHEHSEAAVGFALVLGILIAIAFKLIFSLALLCVLFFLMIWYFADNGTIG